MPQKVSVALVGIGGYGSIYAAALLQALAPEYPHRFVAAVDPFPTRSDRLKELQGRQVPIYPSLDKLYAQHRPELLVISSPFHLHCTQTVEALGYGSHVLCEKPMCVTMGQADAMRRARNRAGRHVAIGYQWSFSPLIQQLKRDVQLGVFGRAKRLKTLVLWPRDESYYSRNRWAGRCRDAEKRPIFDSPVSNAYAHYLHNMLYVLGERTDRSAAPTRVTAELYRAHAIENYDTAALRCWTDRGAEILFVVSHATAQTHGPQFCYEFEKGTITFGEQDGAEIVAHLADGTTRNYGSPWAASDADKLWSMIRSIRADTPPVCGIEAAIAQTQVTDAAQQSMPEVVPFPAELVRTEGESGMRKTAVHGLENLLRRCYESYRLPSELGVPWCRPSLEVEVAPWRDDDVA